MADEMFNWLSEIYLVFRCFYDSLGPPKFYYIGDSLVGFCQNFKSSYSRGLSPQNFILSAIYVSVSAKLQIFRV